MWEPNLLFAAGIDWNVIIPSGLTGLAGFAAAILVRRGQHEETQVTAEHQLIDQLQQERDRAQDRLEHAETARDRWRERALVAETRLGRYEPPPSTTGDHP